ncbi:CREB3 regulatory factor [Triplophysa tibetana]|uniref:CREB3 regulatory factor n=1 Tax=Triplophysa tibetana TaxID=1572043 RepID=A0A5A9PF41_9TELE|nr:CREB3 regulatory factor [Triplophysa tibetana]
MLVLTAICCYLFVLLSLNATMLWAGPINVCFLFSTDCNSLKCCLFLRSDPLYRQSHKGTTNVQQQLRFTTPLLFRRRAIKLVLKLRGCYYQTGKEQGNRFKETTTEVQAFFSLEISAKKIVRLNLFSSFLSDTRLRGRTSTDLLANSSDPDFIGDVFTTPTLAQLNSEDSQPVCDTLYHPDLLGGQKQNLFPPAMGKKCNRLSISTTNPLPDFAEGVQKATWPVASSTETMAKAQLQGAKAQPALDNMDYVRKAKVRISVPRRALVERSTQQQVAVFARSPLVQQHEATVSLVSEELVVTPNTASSVSSLACEKRVETPKREVPISPVPEGGTLKAVPHKLPFPAPGSSETLLTVSALGAEATADEKTKEEEHNYSLFLTRARLAGKTTAEMEEEEEEDEEEGEEDEEEEEAEGEDLDDEDHDEGFGSEHELSENDEEEEEEDDDYEGDKDDYVSDAFSEQGCDTDMVEDVKGLTAGISRKRGKRRYFWEYSEQLIPSKQERMLKPSEWDRDTLPSNLYQRNGLHHGKYTLKKSRRTDVEDLTPNPRKLLQIGNELRKLNKVISDLTPVSELPLTARPRSRKEKNKLASRACRLKKKAQYEANKVKLWGLGTEYDRLLFVINAIKEEIVSRVQDVSHDKGISMAEKLDKLIEETLVEPPVASQTSDFVNQILETTGKGDPTGGLVGLRVPTSKV